ncbi:hypothetical protein [Sphaerisporangium sp. NPDC051011]|uniref:hypothetical protein n=1 Tax=Sphaerisporangium sp. NPDC051011 TaxID=3155792 RepID=UPI0034029705
MTDPTGPALEPAGPATTAEAGLDIPEFDPRRTRRAVRRGIMRTSLTVVVTLVLISLLVTLGSAWFQRRGDRVQRMNDVLGTALQIAYPAYEIRLDETVASPVSLSIQVGMRPLRAYGGFSTGAGFGEVKGELSQDFFGRVRRSPLGYYTETPLTYALYDVRTGNQPKEQMRKVLARLPETMRALAVVEFSAPLTDAELRAFGGQHRACPDLVVYENRPRSTPITWGGPHMSPSTSQLHSGKCSDQTTPELANFRAWVATLRDHDDPNLRKLGLTLDRLRAAATEGKAYAYVDQLADVATLRKIIEDPRVATVRVADLAYDLERP